MPLHLSDGNLFIQFVEVICDADNLCSGSSYISVHQCDCWYNHFARFCSVSRMFKFSFVDQAGQRPETHNTTVDSQFTWLWWWLTLRLSKRHSVSSQKVLLKTTLTDTTIADLWYDSWVQTTIYSFDITPSFYQELKVFRDCKIENFARSRFYFEKQIPTS